MTTTLRITGMTCNHCVHSVDRALRAIPGVSAVEVDLAGGRATVSHDAPVELTRLTAAVESAGYTAEPAG